MTQAMLERFMEKSPVTVMARAVFEYAMSAERIDELFRKHAVMQYENQLLFSVAVDLLGLAVSRSRNSLREAYEMDKEAVGVTIKSLYDKLANTELQVSRALVRDTATQLEPIIRGLKAELPPLVAGYRAKILDGKHLGGTEHRLKETRTLNASPLPGQWLVVLDPQWMLAIDAIPCEDAYTQERKLLAEVLPTVEKARCVDRGPQLLHHQVPVRNRQPECLFCDSPAWFHAIAAPISAKARSLVRAIISLSLINPNRSLTG